MYGEMSKTEICSSYIIIYKIQLDLHKAQVLYGIISRKGPSFKGERFFDSQVSEFTDV